MRLVGAHQWFIRRPFLLEGALKGLLGGLLSLVLCSAAPALPPTRPRLVRGPDLLAAVPDARDRRLRRAARPGGAWSASSERVRHVSAEATRRRRGRRVDLLLSFRPSPSSPSSPSSPRAPRGPRTPALESSRRPARDSPRADQLEEQQQRLQGQVHDVDDELSDLERQRESTQRIVNEIERQIGDWPPSWTARAPSFILAEDDLSERRAVLERQLVASTAAAVRLPGAAREPVVRRPAEPLEYLYLAGRRIAPW